MNWKRDRILFSLLRAKRSVDTVHGSPHSSISTSRSSASISRPSGKRGPKFLQLLVGTTIALCGSSAVQAQQFWRTDGTSGTWVTGTNWGVTPLPAGGSAWVSGSNVEFTANSTATFATTTVGNVTVADGITVTVTQGGTLSTGSASARTFNIGTGSTLNWATQNVSTSANQAGFIKDGAGIWNIGAQGNAYNAANSGFTLNAGRVIVGGNNSFGGTNSVLTINGGTIQSSGTRAYANSSIIIGGNFENTGTGNATFSGTVALGSATRTITNSLTSGSRVYSGVISGSSGSGLTFDGLGAGETAITNAANTFTGDININGGEVRFTTDGSMGNAANDIIIDGGRFATASGATFTLGAGRDVFVGDNAGTSISTPGAGTFTINSAIANKTGETGSWAKQGGGTLELGGISTYTGNTAINNGTLRLTTGNLPTGTTVSLGQAASANLGTLDLNGRSQEIAGLNSTTGTNATESKNTVTSATAATLTIGGPGTSSYGDGTNANSGVITGAISVVKSGSGTQIFGDSNTYTGATTVNGGTLSVLGSLTNEGGLTVASTGTLAGNGTIGGLTTINGNHTPGTSPGIQSFDNLTYNTGSSITWELVANSTADRGISFDGINVGGNLDFAGATTLNLDFDFLGSAVDWQNPFWTTDKLGTNGWLLFDVAGTTSNFGNLSVAFSNWQDGSDASFSSFLSGASFSLSQNGNDVYLNFTAVPEPSSLIMVGLASGIAAAYKSRRRRSPVAVVTE